MRHIYKRGVYLKTKGIVLTSLISELLFCVLFSIVPLNAKSIYYIEMYFYSGMNFFKANFWHIVIFVALCLQCVIMLLLKKPIQKKFEISNKAYYITNTISLIIVAVIMLIVALCINSYNMILWAFIWLSVISAIIQAIMYLIATYIKYIKASIKSKGVKSTIKHIIVLILVIVLALAIALIFNFKIFSSAIAKSWLLGKSVESITNKFGEFDWSMGVGHAKHEFYPNGVEYEGYYTIPGYLDKEDYIKITFNKYGIATDIWITENLPGA